jgi:hypothetical protein
MNAPRRYWRSDGNEQLPATAEAMDEPLSAFPSWFLRIECDRSLRDIIARMRHDGCGGLAAKAELLTGIETVSSRPMRKIVLLER